MKSILFLTITDRLIRLCSSIIVGGLMARSLGVDNYGSYSYIVALYSFFLFLPNSLEGAYSYTYLSKENSSRSKFILLSFSILLSVIACILYLVTSIAISIPEGGFIGALIILTAFQFTAETIASYNLKQKEIAIIKIYSNLLFLIIKLILYFISPKVMHFLLVLFFEGALNSFLLAFICFDTVKIKNICFDKCLSFIKINHIKHESRYVFLNLSPYLLTCLVLFAFNKIDVFFIRYFLDEKAVGYYSSAFKINEGFIIFLSSITGFFYPRILRLSSSEKSYDKLVFDYCSLILYGGLIAFLLSPFIMPFLIKVIFGVEFINKQTVYSATFLTFSSFLSCIAVVNSYWIISKGLTWVRFMRVLSGFIINVTLNYILIPKIGFVGAAFSTLCSQFCMAFIFNLTTTQTRNFSVGVLLSSFDPKNNNFIKYMFV